MKYFYLGVNLRWLVTEIDWPDVQVFHDWVDAFKAAFKDATRGIRFTEISAYLTAAAAYAYNERRQTPLARQTYDDLFSLIISAGPVPSFIPVYAPHNPDHLPRLSEQAHFVGSATHGGLNFTTATSNVRNSFVTFKLPDSTVSVGQIKSIFHHRRMESKRMIVEPFVVINEYASLSSEDQPHDPFHRFPELQTRLYYNMFHPQTRLVRLSDIVAHAATLPYTPKDIVQPCVIVKSLDRVCSICNDRINIC